MLIGNYKRIHFIGIGGTGMSGIAKILLEMGYRVSGSDLKKTEITDRLEEMGAEVFKGHRALNIGDSDLVIVSSAIPPDNPELLEAIRRNIPIMHRADMLGKIMSLKKGIAITGAHGKTTTTSMISLILDRAKFQPTVIIGGELNDIGGNAVWGKGEYLVAEADESDGSFLKLNPKIAVVTNIEDDHLDYYKTMENLIKAFKQFLENLSADSVAVLGIDNENVDKLSKKIKKKYISFAVQKPADFVARNIEFAGGNTFFDVYYKENKLGKLELKVPGLHNINNALAATAVAKQIGISINDIRSVLRDFSGVQRRFQLIGENKNIKVFDDYAHHPTEIKATLAAAKQYNPERIIAVFQPHRYTRTLNLYEEFGDAFADADVLIITDIYSAGEKPITGVTSQLIINSIKQKQKKDVIYIPNKDEIVPYLKKIIRPGDFVFTIGAGDISKVAEQLTEQLNIY
ncbi:MAG: UDP-N-acetylmuramate--alanine ligase [Thermosediminibacterales bacterium]|nr:UDP-N-acetylmuramate--alanine ligase [Thermosediminibacterales bacterium]